MLNGVHDLSAGVFRSMLAVRPIPGRPNARCLIVGEVAQAHDGSLGMAHAFIDAIAAAGADAVKFQTHLAHAESTPAEPWRVRFSAQDDSRYAYWRRMEFTEDQWCGLRAHAIDRGLLFLSSPFSLEAIELLTRVGVAAWKVASGEIANTSMLDRMTETSLPIMLSTGMSRPDEIDAAVSSIRKHRIPLAVLQCTSAYPSEFADIDLRVMDTYRQRYGVLVGYSGHERGIAVTEAAATLGACVVERHFTRDRTLPGPDHAASLEPIGLAKLVRDIRHIEVALGSSEDARGHGEVQGPAEGQSDRADEDGADGRQRRRQRCETDHQFRRQARNPFQRF